LLLQGSTLPMVIRRLRPGFERETTNAAAAAAKAEQLAGDETVRAMLERLDLREAGVTARLNSRF
jgi:hypothetical protein